MIRQYQQPREMIGSLLLLVPVVTMALSHSTFKIMTT